MKGEGVTLPPLAGGSEREGEISLLEGLDDTVRLALREDAADRDVTTSALIPPEARGKGVLLVKAGVVVAGLPVAAAVFRQVDSTVRFDAVVPDGQAVKAGEVVATVEGRLASVLTAERVALNFLQRLSGIATETARYVRAVAGTGAQVLDTRKTTPGLRRLEKYAVRAGGARNHRLDLSDGILVKDNHIAALRATGMSLGDIVRRALASAPGGLTVEFEVTSVEEAAEAIEAGAGMLLLDNMGLEEMKQAAALAKGRGCLTEASGGITLELVRAVAETGVDFISVGALTHSVRALDISLELERA